MTVSPVPVSRQLASVAENYPNSRFRPTNALPPSGRPAKFSDINSETKGVTTMCEVQSDVKSEVKGHEELKVLQKQEKKKTRTDAAESSGDCCEPVCSPITCGP